MKKPRDISLIREKFSVTSALRKATEQYAEARVKYFMVFGNVPTSEGAAAPELKRMEQKSPELSNVPKLKVACTQTQFALLIGRLYSDGLLHSIIEAKASAKKQKKEIPWSEICKYFEKRDGAQFDHKTLASLWSKIENDGKPVRGEAAVTEILDDVKRVSNQIPERITGSLNASRVAKSAPGGISSNKL